jgi:hypothetical protein
MGFMWKTSPVKTIADALKTESTLSGTGVGSTVSIYPTALNNVIGTKFKLAMGYKGSNEAMLAVERGEVEGPFHVVDGAEGGAPRLGAGQDSLDPGAVLAHAAPRAARRSDRRRSRPQRRGAGDPQRDHECGRGRHRLLHHARARRPDRVTALRRAFDATMKDPELLSEAERINVGISPLTGEELQKLVADVSNLSPALLDKVRAAYSAGKTN